ncbi:MAG: DUF2029 domain-containing protein [Deltaproteobacteria bacterium]|nr:DUF2029 domain-containing protein [Deltaproteobacteria bacterium]
MANWLHSLIFSRSAWWALCLLVLIGCGGDICNTLENGSVDLRNRVVGARLLAAGADPYRYTWQAGEPETFLDPISQRARTPENRVSVSPGALAIYAVFSDFHYRSQQLIWLVLQWAAALGTVFLLANSIPQTMDRRFLIMLIALFFLTGESWRFHVERGQIYVFYALVLAASYRLDRMRFRFSDFSGGVLMGMGVLLRPTFIFVSIPFLISKRWRVLVGGLCGILLGMMAIAPFANLPAWRSYVSGMESIGHFYLRTSGVSEGLSLEEDLPQSVEGMRNLSKAKRFDVSPVRLYAVTFLAPPFARSFLLKCGGLIFILAFSILLWRCWKPDQPLETSWIIGITLMMGADFFLPAPRQAYNNIIWCVPLGLLIIQEGASELFRGKAGWVLGIGLLIACGVIHASALDTLGLANLVVTIFFMMTSLRLASGAGSKEYYEPS